MVKKISALVFPYSCPGCQKLINSELSWCSGCWVELTILTEREYCTSCGSNLGPHQHITSKNRCNRCDGKTIPIDGICRVGEYSAAIANAIRDFKYRGNVGNGLLLAKSLLPRMKEQEWFEEIDVICPIPMHWTRKCNRGFNHAEMLAEWISKETSVPMINLLKRSRLTMQQAGLSRTARIENMENVFKIKPQWDVKNANICLIDDVMTTGATIFEAAKTLKKEKPKAIYAAIIAKADRI